MWGRHNDFVCAVPAMVQRTWFGGFLAVGSHKPFVGDKLDPGAQINGFLCHLPVVRLSLEATVARLALAS
jgi:hypothetical protein